MSNVIRYTPSPALLIHSRSIVRAIDLMKQHTTKQLMSIVCGMSDEAGVNEKLLRAKQKDREARFL